MKIHEAELCPVLRVLARHPPILRATARTACKPLFDKTLWRKWSIYAAPRAHARTNGADH
jgi:hypothetical protein